MRREVSNGVKGYTQEKTEKGEFPLPFSISQKFSKRIYQTTTVVDCLNKLAHEEQKKSRAELPRLHIPHYGVFLLHLLLP